MDKNFTASELLGALVEQGSEPTLIETIEDAQSWADTINNGECPAAEITDGEELAEIAPLLDLTAKRLHRVFAFTNGSAGHLALSQDWEMGPSLGDYASAEGLDIVTTCDNYNGYPSEMCHAVTGFSDFSEAEKAARECNGEIIEISRRYGASLWTRGGWMSGAFEYSGEMFGDDYAVYDDAAAYWEGQREALAGMVTDSLDLDDLANLVSRAQNTSRWMEDLNEDECALCRNDNGIYIYVQKLSSMGYEFDGTRHCVAVIERRGR